MTDPSPSHGSPRAVAHLADLTWVDAERILTPETVILIPIGAIEAHGPHLPLDTDVHIATEVACRSATALASVGMSIVIAPPISYGVSVVGTCFPGTVPAPATAVTDLLTSAIVAIARSGPRRFVVVNAHLEPAHVAALHEGVAQAIAQSGASVAFPDKRDARWAATLSEEFQRGARHAGSYETSLMLAVSPERVRDEVRSRLPPVWIDLPDRLRAGAQTFAEAGGTQGYFGDPAAATAVEGERLFAALVTMVLTSLDELGRADAGS